jgi:hypothetical protein
MCVELLESVSSVSACAPVISAWQRQHRNGPSPTIDSPSAPLESDLVDVCNGGVAERESVFPCVMLAVPSLLSFDEQFHNLDLERWRVPH